ncbi:FAD synthetase 1, chloroplastic-like isoform X2 [Wolffia australiana]
MAPPLSKSAPSPFSPNSVSTATAVASMKLGSSIGMRKGFRCEVSAAKWGFSGGQHSTERAFFPSPRLCSCREVMARDCLHYRAHCLSQSSLRSMHFSTDLSKSSAPSGLDINEMESGNDKLLVDCGPDQECVTGGIVALGKFDALHRGHRQLAIQASKAGSPFLLSFVGMAEILGWKDRAPIVAKCDRKRVLSSWAPLCGDVVPLEFHVEFSKVRHLSPRQFVERLSKDLRISGVVAGENYRFGYRASGDAAELVRLCDEFGLEAHILSSVLDSKSSATAMEPVSSTRVRQALAAGDVKYVAELLGRAHRLVLRAPEDLAADGYKLSIPRSCALNQEPKQGLYQGCSVVLNGAAAVVPCHVIIGESHVHVEPLQGPFPRGEVHLIGIDFGC